MAFLSVKVVGDGTNQAVATNSPTTEGVINSLVAYNTTGGVLSFDILLDGVSFITEDVPANGDFSLPNRLNVGSNTVLSVNAPIGVNVVVSYFQQAIDVQGALNAAQQAAVDAVEAYENFDDRYLGPKASDPTLDNDGAALTEGALYWNTSSKAFQIYNGTIWELALPAGSTLDDLSDVNATTPPNSSVLAFDSLANEWKPATHLSRVSLHFWGNQ